jgi:hypothetical protein
VKVFLRVALWVLALPLIIASLIAMFAAATLAIGCCRASDVLSRFSGLITKKGEDHEDISEHAGQDRQRDRDARSPWWSDLNRDRD